MPLFPPQEYVDSTQGMVRELHTVHGSVLMRLSALEEGSGSNSGGTGEGGGSGAEGSGSGGVSGVAVRDLRADLSALETKVAAFEAHGSEVRLGVSSYCGHKLARMWLVQSKQPSYPLVPPLLLELHVHMNPCLHVHTPTLPHSTARDSTHTYTNSQLGAALEGLRRVGEKLGELDARDGEMASKLAAIGQTMPVIAGAQRPGLFRNRMLFFHSMCLGACMGTYSALGKRGFCYN